MSAARWPWAWIAGGVVLAGGVGVRATPHSGMLSGLTPRTWWDGTRTSLGYATPGTVVTPAERDVDGDPEEAADDAAAGGNRAPRRAALTPMQRQMVQGVVAEYVIYLKYLNLENFRDGPVDWRNERFQYASLVPLKDIGKPNAPFRVDERRMAAALDEMEGILTEIGEPAVPLVAEALATDLRYAGAARRRRPPLDYRTPAAVPAGDYNVQALEKFDDLAYGLGNEQPFVASKSPTFVRNEDYRARTRRLLLAIGKPALPVVDTLGLDPEAKVAEHFKALGDAIRAGEMGVAGATAKPFEPPPVDPEARARAQAERQHQERLAALYTIWQEAEVAREEGHVERALELYRKLLASDPLPNYREAAAERIAALTAPKPADEGK